MAGAACSAGHGTHAPGATAVCTQRAASTAVPSRLWRARAGLGPPMQVVAASMLSALEQVHAEGYIHRDVKPANFVMDPADAPDPASGAPCPRPGRARDSHPARGPGRGGHGLSSDAALAASSVCAPAAGAPQGPSRGPGGGLEGAGWPPSCRLCSLNNLQKSPSPRVCQPWGCGWCPPPLAAAWALVDFGLARQYVDEASRQPLPPRPEAAFRGSTTYASGACMPATHACPDCMPCGLGGALGMHAQTACCAGWEERLACLMGWVASHRCRSHQAPCRGGASPACSSWVACYAMPAPCTAARWRRATQARRRNSICSVGC